MNLPALVGTPYRLGGSRREGADCWGLVVLVYREFRGIELPPYNEELDGAGHFEGCRRLKGFAAERIEGELARAWVPVSRAEARPGDAVVLTKRSPADHFGLVVDQRWILTTQSGTGAYLSRWSEWEGRIDGICRYRGP